MTIMKLIPVRGDDGMVLGRNMASYIPPRRVKKCFDSSQRQNQEIGLPGTKHRIALDDIDAEIWSVKLCLYPRLHKV